MKRFLVSILAVAMVFAMCDAQAQTKKKKSGTAKKKPEPAVVVPEVKVVELPYNSNDCIFAIPLQIGVPYGPTTAPDGAGRIQEVKADKAHPNLFDYEHNSVWYKFKSPYNGDLEIMIMQDNEWDDYDFLVYKNTGPYFSNNVILNKQMPVAVNLAAVDSNTLAEAALKATEQQKPQHSGQNGSATTRQGSAQGQRQSQPEQPVYTPPPAPKPTIGMRTDATAKMLTKKQTGRFIKSIPVRMGEEYFIVLDNCSRNGRGHTITVNVHVDAFEPLVLFYDYKAKKYIDVDLIILEKGPGGERPIVKNSNFAGGKVKFIPGYNYTLYAKREGFFSIYRDFNSNYFMRDTVMLYRMNRTEKGTIFQITDVYFDGGGSELLPQSDTTLMNYVAMFRNHPDVTFLVKGYVQSYAVNPKADMLLSLDRAKAVKEFFVKNGIAEERITTTGMSQNEIKRMASAALDKGESFSDVKIELIITEMK
ncbi:MAG: OmpA family protein [Bacteroidales bacterium]|nr:OmpA family protein [Bacteroidales bacterium]